ncbi:DUF4386 domain-containing protein [Actinoplanes derwentensis]|uniref:DUF4386 domain-containing protein n=1 Tax=Actinoplanes derwentensis TaxID=113562 RepID=A0A1H1U0G1_9ACTN|nr:DUF4386 domain-containing protein [Actinoplanes derwentensis]GID85162.1 hypothetical protein Ade03nite_40860 [Actinoplanes derwentensis]SDS66045.1 protein of unknown function [Actinoplanes derwentensis]
MIRTARVTGLLYLGLAACGLFGFILIRPDVSDARVTFELLIVLTQALTAAGFYRLFRSADPVSALGIGAFGLVNAVVVLVSAALLSAATDSPGNLPLLLLLSDKMWAVGSLFFGLWLLPLGTAVLRTKLMPPALGWILVAGAAGYVLHAFLPAALLTVPASIGEFWMIGYLLLFGVRNTTEPALTSGGLDGDDI